MRINISTDLKQAERYLSDIERKILPRAASSAINKALTQTRTQAVRRISKETGLKQKSVRSRFGLQRSRPTTLSGTLALTEGRFPNIASFNGRQTKKGVSANAWGRRKIYHGTFLIQRPWGPVAVARKIRGQRYPLKPIFGPSLVKTMAALPLSNELEDFAQRKFRRLFNHEVKYRLSLLRGGG